MAPIRCIFFAEKQVDANKNQSWQRVSVGIRKKKWHADANIILKHPSHQHKME